MSFKLLEIFHKNAKNKKGDSYKRISSNLDITYFMLNYSFSVKQSMFMMNYSFNISLLHAEFSFSVKQSVFYAE